MAGTHTPTENPEHDDAYEYLGPLWAGHPALEAGLTRDSTDEDIEAIKQAMLSDEEPVPFDPDTLGPALKTWQDDLEVLGDLV